MHQLRAFIAVVKTSLYGRNPNVLHLEGLEAVLLNVQVRLKHDLGPML
jgi:phage-related protein